MKKVYLVIFICALCFSGLYGVAGITNIEPGEVGIMIKMLGPDRGMKQETLDVGTRWVEPFSYDVAVYDTRRKQYEIPEVRSGTKDGQEVVVDLSIEMGLIGNKVPQLHNQVGRDYYNQIVLPAVRSAVRNNTSKQASDKIYTGEGRAEIQVDIEKTLTEKLLPMGIVTSVNLRAVPFTNKDFVDTLERKAKAAQEVVIAKREAERAQQEAIRVANVAEGMKQGEIKKAEAEKERMRLLGEGQRLQQEEQAKGLLALAKVKAEGTKLQVSAYGSGQTYASVQWAENLGPNVKVLGYPLGAPGTTGLFNVDGVLGNALKIK